MLGNWKNFALSIGAIALGLLLAELLLLFYSNVVGFQPGSDFKFLAYPPHTFTEFETNPEVTPGISEQAFFRTNSWGIRGDELGPDDIRILAMGGSTTACVLLDQEKAWPQLLQSNLNSRKASDRYWVGNLGVDGMKIWGTYLQLRDLVPSLPKIDTVLILHGVNDLQYRLIHHKNFEKEIESRMRQLNPRSLGFFERTQIWRAYTQASRAWAGGKNKSMDNIVFYQFVRRLRRIGKQSDKVPDFSSALKHYETILNMIIDEARRQDIEPVLLTQPSLWRINLSEKEERSLWFGGEGDFLKVRGSTYYSARVLQELLSRYNQLTLRVCREKKIRCIDLAAKLPKDHTIFYDDVHFTELGARRVAGIVVDSL